MSIDYPEYITIGCGGIKGFYFLGMLHKLSVEGYLKKVKGYSGSSVGSMISLLLICGYTPKEIIAMAADASIFDDFRTVEINDKLSQMKSGLGIIPNVNIKNYVEEAVIKKFSKIPTLGELYLITGIEFFTVSYNLDKQCKTLISRHTFPNMDCVSAVLLSINIPLFFIDLNMEGKHI